MSSSDGAGSVEQMVTDFSGSCCLCANARADEMVVFPTPPLPMVSASGTPRIGHAQCLSLFSMSLRSPLHGGWDRAANFFLANTCAPYLPSSFVPNIG